MKKLLITLIGALSLGAVLPAVAGPDWQAIEAARKAKQATQVARHAGPDEIHGLTAAASSPKDPYAALPPTGAGPQKCPTDALVLPLDHGPRAQTTPFQNQLRRDRYAAQLTSCSSPRSEDSAIESCNPTRQAHVVRRANSSPQPL